jgi:hypothetical protein
LKARKSLPFDFKEGTLLVLTRLEKRALVTFIRLVESNAFAILEAFIYNYASFLRGY